MSTVAAPSAPTDLMGTKAAATRLRVDPRTVVRWCRAGRVPCYVIGGRWKLSQSELDNWIVNQRYSPAPAPEAAPLVVGDPLPFPPLIEPHG